MLHWSSLRKETPQNKKINHPRVREPGATGRWAFPASLPGLYPPRKSSWAVGRCCRCPGQLNELPTDTRHGPWLLTACTPQDALLGLAASSSEPGLHIQPCSLRRSSSGVCIQRCPVSAQQFKFGPQALLPSVMVKHHGMSQETPTEPAHTYAARGRIPKTKGTERLGRHRLEWTVNSDPKTAPLTTWGIQKDKYLLMCIQTQTETKSKTTLYSCSPWKMEQPGHAGSPRNKQRE